MVAAHADGVKAPSKVVAVVAAYRSEDTVGPTVSALLGVPAVEEVLVVDDGSEDDTAAAALGQGARVLRLARNLGKGGAVRAGIEAVPDADVYLLVDADVGATAGLAEGLLEPVLEGRADMSIAVLPGAGHQGGLGLVRNLATAGIRRATGNRPRAPLSGQRAVRGELLRSLDLADRFGLETAMTIDAQRAGARVVEVELAMAHRHRGRSPAGFRHRAGQGVDILRALWPRLTTPALRLSLMVVCSLVTAGIVLWSADRSGPDHRPLPGPVARVVVVSIPELTLDDLGRGALPNLDRLARDGAVAATSVPGPTPLEPAVLDRPDVEVVEAGSGDLGPADRLVGRVAAGAGPGDVVLVVSLPPGGGERRLTPTIAIGAGVPAGHLYSPSTHRAGLVAAGDLSPTVLSWLGAPVPADMPGQPLTFSPAPGDDGLARAQRLEGDAEFRDDHYLAVLAALGLVLLLVHLAAVPVFRRFGGRGRPARILRRLVLAVSAFPVAALLLRLIPDVAELGPAAMGVLVALDVAVVALVLRARRHALSPLAWVCAATVGLLVADVATGSHLQLSGLLGYSPRDGTRFTGLANSAFAALAAGTILWGGLHVHHAPRRQEAVASVVLAFALVLLADGAPSLGADLGGILTLVPVMALVLWGLVGRRFSLRAMLAAAAMTVAVVGAATAVDLLRPAQSRTHVGRLASRIAEEGWDPLVSTIDRKLEGALDTLGPPWAWPVAAALAVGMVMLGRRQGWDRSLGALVPPGSPLRAGAVGALGVGVLGAAVNDSGVVVTAVVLVYLGPFLVLLSLASREQPAVMEEPPRTRPHEVREMSLGP